MPDINQIPFVFVDFYFEDDVTTISVTAHTESSVHGFENIMMMSVMKEFLKEHFCTSTEECGGGNLNLSEPNHEIVMMRDYNCRYDKDISVVGFEFDSHTPVVSWEMIDMLRTTFQMESTWWLGRNIQFIDRQYARYNLAEPTLKESETLVPPAPPSDIPKKQRRVILPRSVVPPGFVCLAGTSTTTS